MQKWVSLFAGITLQAILGSVYAWSIFTVPLGEGYGITGWQCGLVFGVMICVFTLSAIPAGRLLRKRGPSFTAGIGAALFGAGYIAASLSGGNYLIILSGIGVIAGIGTGFGYVCPISVGMKWFPGRRGLITGTAVAGFGAGAALMSALAEGLFFSRGADALDVFRFTGFVYGGIAFICALLMAEPPGSGGEASLPGDFRLYLFSVRFRLLCLGMFAGTFAGLLVIGNLKPMMLASGLDEGWAALSIPLFAAGNVGGRMLWGGVHDRLGSRMTILISLLVLCLSLPLLVFKLPPAAALSAVLLVGIGFGGCFVIYASSIAELFGVCLFPKLYPFCFLFYGLAALTGPPLGGRLADWRGDYSAGLIVSTAVVIFAAAVIEFRNGKEPEETCGI